MKIFFYITLILSATILVCCELPPEVQQFIIECAKKYGFPEKPTGIPNFGDSKVKCAQACVMKKQKNLEDGKLVLEKVVESLKKMLPGGDTNDLMKLAKECIDKGNKETDECEVVEIYRKCLAEKFGVSPYED